MLAKTNAAAVHGVDARTIEMDATLRLSVLVIEIQLFI